MCPLRFILVFFSAALGGYFAWKTVQFSPEDEKIGSDNLGNKNIPTKDKQEFSLIKMIQNGFWVFIDMASGRYLWRNFSEMNNEKLKST
ncbi:hypothetical protein LguiB_033621 [Lonicera macranthoides]